LVNKKAVKMETLPETKTDGSPLSAAGNEEKGTAGTISERDLKILSLVYVGECDGIYYFRDAGQPNSPLYKGDEPDVRERDRIQGLHPLIDAVTASSVLQMRRAAKATTPFGTVAGDVIGS
jgi:hypothetical protein